MASRGKALVLVQNLSVPFDRRVRQESQALCAAGWDVEVVCPAGEDVDTEPEVVVDGVTVHRYPARPATGGAVSYLREYASALRHMWRLTREVRRRGAVDVVHLCNPPDLLVLVALTLKVRGTRIVYDQHDLVPELYLSRFRADRDLVYRALRLAEWCTYRAADVVISTNNSYRAVALGRGRVAPERCVVVRSAPDPERFTAVPPDPTLARGRAHLICFLGVMGPQDGVDLAVRTLADLAGLRDDWHAVLIGDGDARRGAMALAEELGVASRVVFPGRLPDPEVLRHLSTAAVCLAVDPLDPLNDVSTMNKIVEYMAVGRPVACFDLAEARVSAGEAAVYATPGATDELAGLVSALLDDAPRRERMSAVGHARITGELSWAHSARALLAAYDTACSRRAPRDRTLEDHR